MSRKYRQFSHAPLAPQHIATSTANILHQRGTCVTVYESTLTHYCHSNSIIYLGFTFAIICPMEFWKMYNDRCHHCGIIESSFTPLKLLCALSIHPCLPWVSGDYQSFWSLHSCAFSRMSYSWNPTVCSLFKLASFTYLCAFKFPPCLFITF